MILLRAAGCGWDPDEEILARLRTTAEAFLSAGGAVTLTEWAQLTAPERAAMTGAMETMGRIRPAESEEDRARRVLVEAVDQAAGAIPLFVAGEGA